MPSVRSFFSRPRLLLALWAVALFAGSFSIFQRHHHFPFYYHPDEPGKVEQVLTGQWNFHHPMLLLSSARLAVKLAHVPERPQAVVEAGRLVSAAFMALAVVALSLTAYLWRGWTPAFIAGGALATHHQLYELAHYLKEDSAMLAGVSVAFLAALMFAQVPSLARAAFLGAGCGLAISGKYLGVVVLAVALPALWSAGSEGRPRRLAVFGAALAGVLLLVNLPLITDLFSAPASGTLHQSLTHEMQEVVRGQGTMTRRVPHALYWNVFIDNTTPAVWLLLIAFLSHRRSRRRPEQRVERWMAWFPFVFALVLSFSPKENDRYFLPATAIFTLLAALGALRAPALVARAMEFFGAAHVEETITPRTRLVIVWILAATLWTLQLTGWSSTKPGLLRYDAAFTHDDIADLEAWMRTSLPADAVVLADSRAGLQDPARRKRLARRSSVPQKLLVAKMASDRGTLEELRSQGVGYVVVSETSYGKFFRGDLHAKSDQDRAYQRGKAFYDELLREGELLFERDRGTVIYLHPGVRVYRL